MRKDPTEFRKRFAKWKAGAKPYLYGIPYEDDNHNQNYDLARANQLGYTQDEVGHLPTRDYETGRFLKSTTHPTVSKGVWQDMNMGYDVWYNSEDNSLYSQPNFTSTYKDRLPKYGNGKSPVKRKQSEADVLKALAPSLDPIGDFEIKGNTEPIGEVLLAKKPISESQANSKVSFSDYLDDAEKTATAELAAIYADPERRKNITAEQFFKLYSKTAGYRTRFDRGMGHKGAFLKYIGGIRNEDPKQVRGYLSPGGYMTWNDPATGKRISADAGGGEGVFLNNTIVLGGANVDNFTKAHEWAHWLYNPQRFGEHNPFFMGAGKNFDKPLAPSYFKWALDNDETSNDQLIHNKRWYEGAADINGPVKYELFKKGIFNPGDPDAEITKDQFNTWYNKSPKNRGVERYGVDDTVNFLNNTASIDNQKYDPNKLASAKYGLENFRLPKFGDGTAQDFRYVKDDQGGWNQVTNDEIGRAFQGMVVTPKKTTVKQAPARINNNLPDYRSAYDPNAIRTFTDYLPIVGTAQTAIDVVDSVKQGNYGTAAALGATMIAPSGIGKVAKGLGTVAKQAISAGSTTVGNYISGLAGFEYGTEGSYDNSTGFTSKYEGWSDTAYQKKGDVPTIGYGTTNPKWVKLGRITKEQGRQAMNEDFVANEPLLRKHVKDYDRLPDTAKTVLRDILYNVGQGNMFKKSPKFMEALNNGDYEEAARQMDWDENKEGFGGAKVRNSARRELFLKDLKKNPVKPISSFVRGLYDLEQYQSGFKYQPPVQTDYSLTNKSGGKLNAWFGAGSPAYGGADVRIRNIYSYLNDNKFVPKKK